MKNKKPRVSIIAPCYNGASYVGRFLDSVLSQTYKNIQLIIINDGSTDKTEDVLLSYEKPFADSGIRYVHVWQENQGIGAAINNVLSIVEGKYLTWYGCDDIALPRYIEELVQFLESNTDCAVVRCEGYRVREDDVNQIIGLFSNGNKNPHNPHPFKNAILEKGFHFGYSMLRMDLFDKVNPSRQIYPSRQGQNWQLLLPLFYHYKAAFYEKPLYKVVENHESVSRTPHRSYEKLCAQNKEYENILTNVILSMNIPEQDYYLDLIKEKYIRRRMIAAHQFGVAEDVKHEYANLKQMRRANVKDTIRYWRYRLPGLNNFLALVSILIHYKHNH